LAHIAVNNTSGNRDSRWVPIKFENGETSTHSRFQDFEPLRFKREVSIAGQDNAAIPRTKTKLILLKNRKHENLS